jgi:hypothetical protein
MLRFTQDSASTPDIIYYNASLVNASVQDIDEAPLCRFFEQRQTPLVQDASQYWFSVIRLVANGPGRGLPLFQPIIQVGQSDPNLTVYSFTLEYTYKGADPTGESTDPISSPTFVSQAYVKYSPEDKRIDVPQPPLLRAETSAYYDVHSYGSFVQNCNEAITEALVGRTTSSVGTPVAHNVAIDTTQDVPVDSMPSILEQFQTWAAASHWPHPPTLPEGFAPVLSYDGNTGLFSFTAPRQFQDGAQTDYSLWMNAPAQNLFANFQVERHDKDNGRDYKVIFNKYIGAVTKTVTVTQDRVSTDQIWSPIDSFVFQSTLLPCVNEQSSPPLVLGQNDLNTGVSAAFSPQITDCSIFLGRADDNVSMLYYAPSPQYRLVDMGRQKQAISAIDIQVLWRHRLTQELVPVKLTSLSNISLKVAFIRKDSKSLPM